MRFVLMFLLAFVLTPFALFGAGLTLLMLQQVFGGP